MPAAAFLVHEAPMPAAAFLMHEAPMPAAAFLRHVDLAVFLRGGPWPCG